MHFPLWVVVAFWISVFIYILREIIAVRVQVYLSGARLFNVFQRYAFGCDVKGKEICIACTVFPLSAGASACAAHIGPPPTSLPVGLA
jgi:hypothetical protein